MIDRDRKDWMAAASVAAVLRNEAGTGAVAVAYETIVKNAFALKDAGTRVARDKICNLVAECTFTTLPAAVVNDAVVQLIGTGELILSCEEDVEYVALSGSTHTDIQRELSERASLKRRVFDAWLDSEVKDEPDLADCRAELEQVVEEHIGRVISFLAADALADWDPSHGGGAPEPPAVDSSLLDGRPPVVQRVGVAACRRFFKNADGERRGYLEALVDGYYELQLLRCTPEIQDVFTAQLSDTDCYLDTNVLIDLLGVNEDDGQTELARQAVAMSVELGIRVLVSEETRKEYIGLIDEAEQQHQHVGRVQAPSSDRPEKGSNAGCFLVGYLSALAKDRALTWNEFRRKYENLPSLLKRYHVDYASGAKVANRDEIEPVAQLFDSCCKWKRTRAREHDAAMYLLIREFRRQKGTGLRTWLLTRDYSLSLFDKQATRTLPPLSFPMPSFAMRPYSWIEWLRSRTPGKTAPGIVHLLCDLTFTRPKRDYRVVARQIEYMETYRDLEADLIQSFDCTRLLDEELARLGRPTADVSDEELIALVDKAILDNADQMVADGRLAEERAMSLADRVQQLERTHSDELVERKRLASRLAEVESSQVEIKDENKDLRLQNERLQMQNRLTAVAIVLGLSFYAVIRIGTWWAYPLMLLPLLWWVARKTSQTRKQSVLARLSLVDIYPSLGACLLVGLELVVCPHLPKNLQQIAKNEFLWLVAFLATAGQLVLARRGGSQNTDRN